MSGITPLSHDRKTIKETLDFVNEIARRGELKGLTVVVDHFDTDGQPLTQTIHSMNAVIDLAWHVACLQRRLALQMENNDE